MVITDPRNWLSLVFFLVSLVMYTLNKNKIPPISSCTCSPLKIIRFLCRVKVNWNPVFTHKEIQSYSLRAKILSIDYHQIKIHTHSNPFMYNSLCVPIFANVPISHLISVSALACDSCQYSPLLQLGGRIHH